MIENYKGFEIGTSSLNKFYIFKNINNVGYYLHTNGEFIEWDDLNASKLYKTVYHKELSDVYKAIDKYVESEESSKSSSNQQLVIVTNTQTIKEDLEDDKEYNILYEQDYIKVTSENKMVAMFSRDVAKYIYIERS